MPGNLVCAGFPAFLTESGCKIRKFFLLNKAKRWYTIPDIKEAHCCGASVTYESKSPRSIKMTIEQLEAYELIEKKAIDELKSTGYYLKHRKTGAKVCLLSNEDNNKVFYIGFRTPAPDDTGVPHILEHSVLCGSKEFPVKDPFVELAKGSLNTFLNAMTYPDKTVYPVAIHRTT